ncbi:MAG TPA: serine/threonine-protein kinase, partial [Verrucomicrobiae bacterium]|nr:serine/threonine-protein kinase [Verrucomicrobiae bacterium]
LRVLGGGGMGVVLLARDSESGREVALKMVRPELVPNQQIVHRFVKEAGHLQKLKHPNVVPVLEVSDRPQGPYFVMPYFEQGSLAQHIKPGQGLGGPEVLNIALQVAEGLQFAHRRGIIHRDLKPANILLGAEGKTCLADFGLARTMFNDTIVDVEREQLEGTAPYMSPGVAAGHAEDTRCDIYAFGALLYEMLTGDPPYVGRSTQDIRQQILAGPPKPIRARNPEADAGLAIVAEGAMARELRNRYADMGDVLADLERIRQGRPPTGPHGLARRVRRSPAAVWIAAGAVLGALLWMLWPKKPAAATQQLTVTHPVTNSAPPVVVTSAPPVVRPQPIVVPPRSSPPIVVGAINAPGASDGLGNEARFSSPGAIAVDSTGYIYVADMANDTIRKVSPSGDVGTLAGVAGKAGEIDGRGGAARFTAPSGIAVDNDGNVYVAEFASDTIRKINPEGSVNLLAGSPGNPGWNDAKGDNAHFRNPWSVAVDKSGNVYVADKDNFVIRQIAPDGRVTTIAGKPGVPGFVDGKREAARFNDPHGIAVDDFGIVYVTDTASQAVRRISPPGEVTTIAKSLSNPESIAVDGAGVVYVTDSIGIHKIWNGKIELLPPLLLTSNPDGPIATADSVAVDKHGVLYLVDTAKDIVCWQTAK